MRGFTLVEVVVALLLFEVVVLGVVGTLRLAAETLHRAETLERAVVAAQAVSDSLAGADGAVTEGSRAFVGGRVSWEAGGELSGSTVRAVSLSGDTLIRLVGGATP